MSSLRAITKGAGIVFAGLVIAKALSFLYRLFIVRAYTATDYGLFSESVAVITLLKTVAIFGMATAMVRYVAFYGAKKDGAGVRHVFATIMKFSVLVSATLAAASYMASDYIALSVFGEPGLADFLRVFSVSLPFYCSSLLIAYYFMGLKMAKEQITLQEVAPNLLRLAILAALWIAGIGTMGIAWSWTISFAAVALISLPLLKRTLAFVPDAKDSRPIGLFVELLVFSIPMFVSDFVITLMNFMGTISVGIFNDAALVGIYNAAVPVADMLLVVPLSFSALFMPLITECYSLRRAKLASMTNRFVIKWVFLTNLAGFLPMALFSQQLLSVMFGSQYAIGGTALAILALGFMISSFEATAIGILAAIKKTRYIMISIVSSAAVNLLLSVYLVPLYGIIGAALSMAVSFILKTVISVAFVWKLKRINPLGIYVLKGLAAGVLASVTVYIVYKSVFNSASLAVFILFYVLFCLLYAFMLLLFKCFDKEDIEIIKAVRKKTGLKLVLLSKIAKRLM
jgi:O-antigen/teichoic acid export membrane protein